MNSATIQVEVLGFQGCPNTPALQSLVQEAVASISHHVEVSYIDLEALGPDDIRRGYPAPAMLVNGRSFFGDATPETPSMGCRSFPDGLPSAIDIQEFIKQSE